MTTTQPWEKKMREDWNDAFLPEVPTMLKSAEVKNKDGSYSCITCGIKKDNIADWWIEEITSTRLSAYKEGQRDMRESVVALIQAMRPHPSEEITGVEMNTTLTDLISEIGKGIIV